MLMAQAPPRAIGVNLVLFFAGALAALVLLAHTLVDITRIRAGINEAVRPATTGMAADTALLPTLAATTVLTGRLSAAADGINAALAEVARSMDDVDPRIDRVRADSRSIAGSVAGIAESTSLTGRGVTDLAAGVRTTRADSAQIASALAGARRAVATVPDDLAAAAAQLRSLARVIPSITQRASAITAGLRKVDGHLVDVNGNALIRLTNLLQLTNLLGGGR
jgi:ABC-type transporter Mla subunit MlaD